MIIKDRITLEEFNDLMNGLRVYMEKATEEEYASSVSAAKYAFESIMRYSRFYVDIQGEDMVKLSATDHAYKWAYKLYEWHATAIEEGTYVDYKDALLQSEASYREILERRAQAEEERKQKARENLERMREERKERNRLWSAKVKAEYEEYLQSDVIKKSKADFARSHGYHVERTRIILHDLGM